MERESHNNPEEIIQNLVDSLEIIEGIKFEPYGRSSWYKQYGNDADPEGEYEIRLNEESVKGADEAKKLLLEFGNKQPEFLGQILEGLLSKQLPAYETRYVISRTETGIQNVVPEPGEHGWTWVSGSETKRIIDNTVLGFGLKAVPYLESMESRRSRNLIARVKRRELAKKIKEIFIRSPRL